MDLAKFGIHLPVKMRGRFNPNDDGKDKMQNNRDSLKTKATSIKSISNSTNSNSYVPYPRVNSLKSIRSQNQNQNFDLEELSRNSIYRKKYQEKEVRLNQASYLTKISRLDSLTEESTGSKDYEESGITSPQRGTCNSIQDKKSNRTVSKNSVDSFLTICEVQKTGTGK